MIVLKIKPEKIAEEAGQGYDDFRIIDGVEPRKNGQENLGLVIVQPKKS